MGFSSARWVPQFVLVCHDLGKSNFIKPLILQGRSANSHAGGHRFEPGRSHFACSQSATVEPVLNRAENERSLWARATFTSVDAGRPCSGVCCKFFPHKSLV